MSALNSVASADVSSRVGIAVAKTALDQAEKQGSQMVDMIRSAAPVGDGGRGAVSQVPAASETGGQLDVSG
jgi:hypothetical protein